MDALVAATLQHGLVPPVVMEFPGITVGGGFAGTSGESSSFKHGFFDRSVTWIEIVLGNGDVVRASGSEHADLFAGAAGSFGTLGVVTALELRLVDARECVEVSYASVGSVDEAVRGLEAAMGDPDTHFVDGIMFSRSSGTVVTGKLTSCHPLSRNTKAEVGARMQTFHRAQDPWFYLHAQHLTALSTSSGRTPSPASPVVCETVPLESYLFRYDRGAFWTGAHAFRYFCVPFTSFFRRLLNHFMHTRVMYHALHESGHMDRYILQDCVLPASRAGEFIEWVDVQMGIWPLWLCPVRGLGEGESRSFHPWPRGRGDRDWGLNVGVWGPGPTEWSAFVEINRGLERKLGELGGMKWLYAQVFCSEGEFWERYDREGYEALREKWHASSLPSVWEKVRRKDKGMEIKGVKGWLWKVWPVSGLYGVWRAWGGGEYLVKRERERRDVWVVVLFAGLAVWMVALSWVGH
jgi:delta24-sterol reductase